MKRGNMMKVKDLVKHAEEFVSSNFNLKLDVPIKISGRLKTSLGQFVTIHDENNEVEDMEISLSKTLIEYYTKDEIISTLEHELVHYCLFVTGQPDDDDSPEFIETCKRLNVPLTETLDKKGKFHVYKCKCSKFYEARRLNKNSTYYCGDCKGELKYSHVEELR